MPPTTSPYGSWASPITTDLIVAESVGLGQIALDGDDVYWVELRPLEAGRQVVVKRTPDGAGLDVTPAPFNVRTRVHEYGGGAYAVSGGTVYFTNFADQRVYRQPAGQDPCPITPEEDIRHADFEVDLARSRLVCVQENHSGRWGSLQFGGCGPDGHPRRRHRRSGGVGFAERFLFVAPAESRRISVVLVELEPPEHALGRDRVVGWRAGRRWQGRGANAGGRRPRRVHLSAGVGSRRTVVLRVGPERVVEPAPVGQPEPAEGPAKAFLPMEAEFGRPQWVFGAKLLRVRLGGPGHLRRQPQWGLGVAGPSTWRAGDGRRWTSAATRRWAGPICGLPATRCSSKRAGRRSQALCCDWSWSRGDWTWSGVPIRHRWTREYLSAPETIEFPTEGGLTAHAFFYPPRNRDFTAPEGAKPPLLLKSHGGPTAATSNALDLEVQFWTSRGFAVVDVNYGGSTGYGTEYRRRLERSWGVVDVDDCVNAARHLASQGLVDEKQLAIDGGSAGGYTTLAALTFRDIFSAGASYFGVSDLETLARDTHKFESRYLDTLVGPYPEEAGVYRERSPINFTERLSRPIILLQGLEDRIVPPDQAEAMFDAVRAKGIPTAYLAFAGEQHGFRQAGNIKRALEAELYFFCRLFGIEPADEIEPVHIENL